MYRKTRLLNDLVYIDMEIKREKYQEEVIVPKFWEHIIIDGKPETVLISKKVQTYIRSLESQIQKLEQDVR